MTPRRVMATRLTPSPVFWAAIGSTSWSTKVSRVATKLSRPALSAAGIPLYLAGLQVRGRPITSDNSLPRSDRKVLPDDMPPSFGLCCAGGEGVDFSPPRDRKAQGGAEGRKFSWATQRIAELETELEKSKRRYKVELSRASALQSMLHKTTLAVLSLFRLHFCQHAWLRRVGTAAAGPESPG